MAEPGPRFDHTENDLGWVGALLALTLVASLPLLAAGSRHPLSLAAVLLPAASLLLTHSLRVQVDEQTVRVQLGNGWIRRSIELRDIRGLQRRTRSRGWGPRWKWGGGGTTVLGFGARPALCIQLDDELICIATEAASELESFLTARLREERS